ncbi:hypothetical protein [Streptomyces sp. NPDC051109]|uniref:hypothetical protein n=1 Tax=Streptomyces sp. NPDC051109 TaxID=3365642 RepID=UPI0037A0F3B7
MTTEASGSGGQGLANPPVRMGGQQPGVLGRAGALVQQGQGHRGPVGRVCVGGGQQARAGEADRGVFVERGQRGHLGGREVRALAQCVGE